MGTIMTLQEYKNLSDKQQTYVFKHKAVMISTLHRDNEVYTLFQLYGFYIEVFSYETGGLMSSINYFEEPELLEPYLQLVNINPVYAVLNYKR